MSGYPETGRANPKCVQNAKAPIGIYPEKKLNCPRTNTYSLGPKNKALFSFLLQPLILCFLVATLTIVLKSLFLDT